jgi:hypothetical protein
MDTARCGAQQLQDKPGHYYLLATWQLLHQPALLTACQGGVSVECFSAKHA